MSSSEVQREAEEEEEELDAEELEDECSCFSCFLRYRLILSTANFEAALIKSLPAPGCSCLRYGSAISLILSEKNKIWSGNKKKK